MQPAWEQSGVRLYLGDALQVLRTLPDCSIDCCVTSPPYWGLRDYGVAGQIGLEKTPLEFVAKMVDVFRELRRVLTNRGTCWVNLGDSYSGIGGKGTGGNLGRANRAYQQRNYRAGIAENLKPKDLVGIPWRVAFALHDDGWFLRSDIIWHKPTAMPESVKDRPTKAHEYLFLLTKSARYHYDADAIKEPASADTHARYARGRSSTHKNADGGPGGQTIAKTFEHMRPAGVNPKAAMKVPSGWDTAKRSHGTIHVDGRTTQGPKQNASFAANVKDVVEFRNKRSVWTIAAEPCSDAHFATFPTKLVEPCILAGCPVGGVVLDPFLGSGTVAAVAVKHGRQAVGIELNPTYLHDIAVKRITRALEAEPLLDGVESIEESHQKELFSA